LSAYSDADEGFRGTLFNDFAIQNEHNGSPHAFSLPELKRNIKEIPETVYLLSHKFR